MNWVIRLGQRSERAQPPPLQLSPWRHGPGVKPGSAAEVMGLAPGDVIMAVNDLPVPTPEDVQQAMMPWAIDPAIAVDRQAERQRLSSSKLQRETAAFGSSICTGFKGT